MAKPGRGGRAVSPSGSGSSSRSHSPSRSRSFSSSSYPSRSGSSSSRSPSPSPSVNKNPAEETKRGRYPPPQSKKSSPPPSTIIFGMSQQQPPSPNSIPPAAANHVRQTIMRVQIGIASVMGILVSFYFSYEISPGEKSPHVGLGFSYATLILALVLSVLELCGAYIKIFLEDECQPIWNGCWYEWPAFGNLPREWFWCSSEICMGVVVVLLNLGSAAVHLALCLTNCAIAPPIMPLCLAVITFI